MSTLSLTDFGKALRKHRIDHSMTMMALANGIGVTPAYLSNVETGRKAVNASLIEKVVGFIGLSEQEARLLTAAASKAMPDVTLRPDNDFEANLALTFARRLESKNLNYDALLKALESKP